MYRHKKNTPSLKKADHSPLMDILSKLSDTFQNNGDLNELQVLVDELISQVFVPVHMKLEKLLDLFKNIRDLLKNRELETVLRLKLCHCLSIVFLQVQHNDVNSPNSKNKRNP